MLLAPTQAAVARCSDTDYGECVAINMSYNSNRAIPVIVRKDNVNTGARLTYLAIVTVIELSDEVRVWPGGVHHTLGFHQELPT